MPWKLRCRDFWIDRTRCTFGWLGGHPLPRRLAFQLHPKRELRKCPKRGQHLTSLCGPAKLRRSSPERGGCSEVENVLVGTAECIIHREALTTERWREMRGTIRFCAVLSGRK
eukprot:883872-Rhodomonas_salina.2